MQITQADKNEMFLLAHPVGSYYFSNNSTSPGVTYGGTWDIVTGCFLYANSSSSTVIQNRSSDRYLKESDLAYHYHPTSHGHTGYDHDHGGVTFAGHVHSIPAHTHSTTISDHHHTVTQSQWPNTANIELWGDNLTQYYYWQNISGKDAQTTINPFYIARLTDTYKFTTNSSSIKSGYTSENNAVTSTSSGAALGSESPSISSAGSGRSFSILPSRQACYCWRRSR